MRKQFVFIAIAMALLLAMVGIATAATVTQSITYQGVLTDSSGNPRDGSFSMTFRLYDVASGGTALATNTQSVTVDNGLFTTPVTFDSGFFDGRALWLGIAVGIDPEMTPRQEIRPVPYALGLRPGAQIISTESSPALVLRNTGSGYALNVTSAGAAAALRASTISGTSNAVWGSTSGNGPAAIAGTTTGTGSPGVYAFTTGSKSPGVYGESSQDVGVYGKGKQGGYFTTNQAGTIWPGWLSGVNVSTSYNYNPGVQIETKGSMSDGLHVTTAGLYSFGVYAESAQDVGVFGVGKVGGSFLTNQPGTPNNLLAGVDISTAYNYNPGIRSITSGSGSNAVYAESRSINTPAIFAKSVGQNSPAISADTSCTGCNAVHGSTSANGPAAVAGTTTGNGSFGIYASTTGSGSHGMYSTTSGSGSHGFVAYTSKQAADAFYGETAGFGSYGVLIKTTGDNSRGIYTETHGADATGLHAYSEKGHAIYGEAGPAGGYAALLKGNVNVLSKSTGASVLELGEGLDYSEGFDLSGEDAVAPGTVLVISRDDPGTLTVSREPYDRKVAGIVAGANGIGSAVKVGGDKFDANVALAGRVYCNVDATYGAVEPGDQLTTSATPGYAMVVQDYTKAQGATIGKAMEGLEQGQKGQILVLVTLQ